MFSGFFKKNDEEAKKKEEELKMKKRKEQEDNTYKELKKSVAHLLLALPDETHCSETDLRRFARAFKYNVNDAFIGLMSTLQWRNSPMYGVESIHAITEEMVTKEKSFETCVVPSFLDRSNRPIVIITVRNHDREACSLDGMMKYTILQMESANKLMPDGVCSVLLIFDLSGLKKKNLDFPWIKEFINVFTKHYPERLGMALLLAAPMVFEGAWKLIRPWLDPETREKVQFVKDWKDLDHWIEGIDRLPDSVKSKVDLKEVMTGNEINEASGGGSDSPPPIEEIDQQFEANVGNEEKKT